MYLLDAAILIDFLNRIPMAVDYMVTVDPRKTSISAVTLAEILVGADENEQEQILQFVGQFHFLNIDKSISISAAQLRKKYRWKLPDAFQAALSLKYNLIFITRNTKDFDPTIHKFVKIPYKIH